MALDPIKGGIFLVAMLGFTRSVYKRLEDYAVRKDAKKIYDARKALYTEVPEHRLLGEDELLEDRNDLAAFVSGIEGLVPLGDYVDVYAPGSRFYDASKPPYHLLRTEDQVVVALVFRPRGSEVVRVHLVTELTNGKWIVTENNRLSPVAKQRRPEGTDTDHQPAWTAPWKLLEAHRAHVATALAEPGVLAVKIASFEDYVASHERRWDAIRADRKKNGWVGEGEIAFPARVKPPVRKRIYAEIARIAKVDAERS